MRRFKNLALTTTALALGLIGVASAADLRPAAPPPVMVAPAPSWAGFYIGGHLGGGWGEDSNSAFIGGGQIGYNFQFAPNWVLGIEADISGTDAGGTITRSVPG